MTRRIWRGDAPAAKRILVLREPRDANVPVTLRAGNKSIGPLAWSPAALATAWNASPYAEQRLALAAARGEDLEFTARTAGVPFHIEVTLGNGATGRNEVQVITLINNPGGGTWIATFEGATTGGIAHNASAATVQAALEALATIDVGDVTVTGSAGGPWTVTFGGRFSGENVPPLVVNGTGLTGGDAAAAIATVQNGGGSGSPTTSNTNPSEGDAGLHAGSIKVHDEPEWSINDLWQHSGLLLGVGGNVGETYKQHGVIRFPVNVARGVTLTAASLTLYRATGSGSITLRIYAEAADNAAYPATGATVPSILARPLTTTYVEVTLPGAGYEYVLTGLAPVLQEVIDRAGWASGQHVQLHLRTVSGGIAGYYSDDEGDYDATLPELSVTYTPVLREIQTVQLTGSSIRSGQVTLSLDGHAMSALDHDATAAEAQAAAAALAGVGSGNVLCTGGPWPALITFSFASSLGNLPQMTATDTLVNGNVLNSTTLQGGPALLFVELQRSRGPNHYDDPLNWQTPEGVFGVPGRLDDVDIPEGKVDILWGTAQRTVFTAVPGTDRLVFADRQCALAEGQTVEVRNTGGGLPGGLSADTTYYVRDIELAGPSCRLATTLDGAPVAISSAGTGTQEIGVRLTRLTTDARYTGKLGLPRVQRDGAFLEFRPRFLKAWIDAVTIGRGDGTGPSRAHLDTGGRQTALKVITSQGGTDNAPAVQWLGTGTGNTVEIIGGNVGVAIDPDQAAAFDSLVLRSGACLVGPQVAAGDIERTGGTLKLLGTQVGGTVLA